MIALVLLLSCAPPAGPAAATGSPAAPASAQAADPTGDADRCVDATLEQELLAKRKYRLTRERLFVKSLRHELAFLGGYYASDVFDGTYAVGGSYTFFPSENFGAELHASWSRLRTSTADTIEEANNFDLRLGRDDIVRVFGSLQWSPFYGKLRLVAASIWRYDFYLLAGPGVVVDPISYGAAGNFGFGLRVFLAQPVALRVEVRDHLYRQELLSRSYLVNDIGVYAGVSLLLPFRN